VDASIAPAGAFCRAHLTPGSRPGLLSIAPAGAEMQKCAPLEQAGSEGEFGVKPSGLAVIFPAHAQLEGDVFFDVRAGGKRGAVYFALLTAGNIPLTE